MQTAIFKRTARQGLSAQQHLFARDHRGIPEVRASWHDRAVYIYRDEGWRTFRWLVDPNGNVLDFISLRYSEA
jgi:hypothetical protein